MVINTNINALRILNRVNANLFSASTAMNRIASGRRINSAADDPAGMAIASKMEAQIRGLEQAKRNAQDGISVVQTAEGTTEEVGNIVQRMRELSVQAANETNTAEDRAKIVEELKQLYKEINRISGSTQFNQQDLLNGTDKVGTRVGIKEYETGMADKYKITSNLDIIGIKGEINLKTIANGDNTNLTITLGTGTTNEKEYTLENINTDGKAGGSLKAGDYTLKSSTGETLKIRVKEDQDGPIAKKIATAEDIDVKGKEINLQVGPNTTADQQIAVRIDNMDTSSLGINMDNIEAMKKEGPEGTKAAKDFIDSLDDALGIINSSRARLGAMENRLEITIDNITTSSENLTEARSRIMDADIAKEMMNLSRSNLLLQASQAMLLQAKQQPEWILELLRS